MTPTTPTASEGLQERVRAERESLYREAIAEAAERVFAAKGSKGSRMNEIAAEAGISLGTLYGVIDGKDSLYSDIHRARMLEFIDCISAARDAHETTLDRHLAVLREGGRFFLDRPDFLRMCSRDGYGWSSRVPDVDGETNLWDRGVTIPLGLFQRGIDEGLYVAGDAGLLVRKMLALKQVELTHWVDEVPNTPPDQVLDRLEDQFVRAFCTSQHQRAPHESRPR